MHSKQAAAAGPRLNAIAIFGVRELYESVRLSGECCRGLVLSGKNPSSLPWRYFAVGMSPTRSSMKS